MIIQILEVARKTIAGFSGKIPDYIQCAIERLEKYGIAPLQKSGEVEKFEGTHLYDLKAKGKYGIERAEGESKGEASDHRVPFDLIDSVAYILHAFPKKGQKAKRELRTALIRSKELRIYLKSKRLT